MCDVDMDTTISRTLASDSEVNGKVFPSNPNVDVDNVYRK